DDDDPAVQDRLAEGARDVTDRRVVRGREGQHGPDETRDQQRAERGAWAVAIRPARVAAHGPMTIGIFRPSVDCSTVPKPVAMNVTPYSSATCSGFSPTTAPSTAGNRN